MSRRFVVDERLDQVQDRGIVSPLTNPCGWMAWRGKIADCTVSVFCVKFERHLVIILPYSLLSSLDIARS